VPTQNNKSDDEEYEERKKPSERPKRAAKVVTPRLPSKQETDQDPVSHDENFELEGDASDPDGEEMLLNDEELPDGEEDDLNYTETTTPKPRSKSRKKREGIKTEDGPEESPDEAEGDENVFIDNLPKDE
jgi:hypothetical protein